MFAGCGDGDLLPVPPASYMSLPAPDAHSIPPAARRRASLHGKRLLSAVIDLRAFYSSPLGMVALRMVRRATMPGGEE